MTHIFEKTLAAALMATTLSTGVNATESAPAANTVSVTVSNIDSQQGSIMAAIYSSSEGFLNAPFQGMRVDVNGESTIVTFKDLPAGEYAISLFHDVDADGELDSGFMGIPKEPYGFSNNAPVRFGPAKWDAAKFTVSGQTAQAITLK